MHTNSAPSAELRRGVNDGIARDCQEKEGLFLKLMDNVVAWETFGYAPVFLRLGLLDNEYGSFCSILPGRWPYWRAKSAIAFEILAIFVRRKLLKGPVPILIFLIWGRPCDTPCGSRGFYHKNCSRMTPGLSTCRIPGARG